MMREFERLYTRLDQTTKTNEKVAALADYFEQAHSASAAWAIYFLTGRRLKRLVPSRQLRQWATQLSGLPDWLVDESYQAVGDLAETLSMLVPPPIRTEHRPLEQIVTRDLLPLKELDETECRERVIELWMSSPEQQRLLLNKLITGALRVGVSQKLVIRGLAQTSGLSPETLAHRMMGDWEPTEDWYRSLLDQRADDTLSSRPYPFLLAHPLETTPDELGERTEWLLEWKWDGIRAQAIRRDGGLFVWSRGEELMDGRFPELETAFESIPDGTVLDGEILAFDAGHPLPFNVLQTRINRKRVTAKIQAECPVRFQAFDLLEFAGIDWRPRPLRERRAQLESLLSSLPDETPIAVSPQIAADDWQDAHRLRASARERQVEGLMIKRLDSEYGVGRVRGSWWKWKVEPLTVDAVLLYAQPGHGRRASLYTDYTFAVWDEGQLVPFAKAYSGLTDAEIRQVDRFVRQHTQERFGPVRSVTPELVFELAFEGIHRSSRHKSGIAVRFPRIVRWRQDKPADQANTLQELHELLDQVTRQPKSEGR